MATWKMVFVQYGEEMDEAACGHRGVAWGALATLTLPTVPLDERHKSTYLCHMAGEI